MRIIRGLCIIDALANGQSMDLTVVRSRDRSEHDKSCVVLIFWFISSNKNKNERAVRVLRWSNEVEAVRRSIFKSKIRNYKEQNNDDRGLFLTAHCPTDYYFLSFRWDRWMHFKNDESNDCWLLRHNHITTKVLLLIWLLKSREIELSWKMARFRYFVALLLLAASVPGFSASPTEKKVNSSLIISIFKSIDLICVFVFNWWGGLGVDSWYSDWDETASFEGRISFGNRPTAQLIERIRQSRTHLALFWYLFTVLIGRNKNTF